MFSKTMDGFMVSQGSLRIMGYFRGVLCFFGKSRWDPFELPPLNVFVSFIKSCDDIYLNTCASIHIYDKDCIKISDSISVDEENSVLELKYENHQNIAGEKANNEIKTQDIFHFHLNLRKQRDCQ